MAALVKQERRLLIGQASGNPDFEQATLCVVAAGSTTALCKRVVQRIWPYIPVSCVGNPDRKWCPKCAARLGVAVIGAVGEAEDQP